MHSPFPSQIFHKYQQFPISRYALFLGGMRESAFVNFLEQSHDGTGGWLRYGGPPADAFARLAFFELWVKQALAGEPVVHVDETGINVGGTHCWLHNTSSKGLSYFCRIRSYVSTCRKQGLTASEALRLLFQGKWPAFMAASPVSEGAE